MFLFLSLVAQPLNPSTEEAEASGSLWVWSQPELHNKTLSQKQTKNLKKKISTVVWNLSCCYYFLTTVTGKERMVYLSTGRVRWKQCQVLAQSFTYYKTLIKLISSVTSVSFSTQERVRRRQRSLRIHKWLYEETRSQCLLPSVLGWQVIGLYPHIRFLHSTGCEVLSPKGLFFCFVFKRIF